MSQPDVYFVNSEYPPIETKHICWFVRRSGTNPDDLNLYEVVEEKYPHPTAPQHAFVFLTKTHCRKTINDKSRYAGPLIVLKAAEETMSQAEFITPGKS